MAYVGFGDNGYEYLSREKDVLFFSNNEHNDLFDYVTKDLSSLPDLFEKYISDRMDVTTFKLNECQDNNVDINTIIEILKTIHPYFQYEYEKELLNKIGNYFNKLLVYTIFHQNKDIENYAKNKDWYCERLNKLIPSFLWANDTCCNDFFYKFVQWMGYELGADEWLVHNVPKKKPMGFIDEIIIQEEICHILYYILDISAPDIGEMKIPQRIWLYGYEFGDIGAELNVTQRLFFKPPIRFGSKADHEECDVPTDVTNNSKSAIEHAKGIKDYKIYEEYEINSLRDLLYLEIMNMAKSNTMIRKCRFCDKYFVVKNRKKLYCDRKTESSELCSVVGPKTAFQRKLEGDEVLRLYNRARNTHYVRRENEKMSDEEYYVWICEAKKKLNEVRSGNLDIESFQEWLKK